MESTRSMTAGPVARGDLDGIARLDRRGWGIEPLRRSPPFRRRAGCSRLKPGPPHRLDSDILIRLAHQADQDFGILAWVSVLQSVSVGRRVGPRPTSPKTGPECQTSAMPPARRPGRGTARRTSPGSISDLGAEDKPDRSDRSGIGHGLEGLPRPRPPRRASPGRGRASRLYFSRSGFHLRSAAFCASASALSAASWASVAHRPSCFL